MDSSSRQSSSNRPVSRRGEPKVMTADPYANSTMPLRPTTAVRYETKFSNRNHFNIYISISIFRGLASARPPSALAGGTATRLVSAMYQPGTASSAQRVGTAIGFKDNVAS